MDVRALARLATSTAQQEGAHQALALDLDRRVGVLFNVMGGKDLVSSGLCHLDLVDRAEGVPAAFGRAEGPGSRVQCSGICSSSREPWILGRLRSHLGSRVVM